MFPRDAEKDGALMNGDMLCCNGCFALSRKESEGEEGEDERRTRRGNA